MKKLFALPVIGLILGAVAIATEIKTTDFISAGQELSAPTIACIKTAIEKRETTMFSVYSLYQNNNLTALTTRKISLLAAFDTTTKSEMKSAISTAWKVYKKSLSEHTSILHKSRNLAWSTFNDDVKICKWTLLLQNIDNSSVRSE